MGGNSSLILVNIDGGRVATEAEVPISAQSQKVIDDGRQHNRLSKSPNRIAETIRANDPSLLSYSTAAGADEKSVSPSSGRLRTSPRSEVLPCIDILISENKSSSVGQEI